jgi:hypothetical protein
VAQSLVVLLLVLVADTLVVVIVTVKELVLVVVVSGTPVYVFEIVKIDVAAGSCEDRPPVTLKTAAHSVNDEPLGQQKVAPVVSAEQ